MRHQLGYELRHIRSNRSGIHVGVLTGDRCAQLVERARYRGEELPYPGPDGVQPEVHLVFGGEEHRAIGERFVDHLGICNRQHSVPSKRKRCLGRANPPWGPRPQRRGREASPYSHSETMARHWPSVRAPNVPRQRPPAPALAPRHTFDLSMSEPLPEKHPARQPRDAAPQQQCVCRRNTIAPFRGEDRHCADVSARGGSGPRPCARSVR